MNKYRIIKFSGTAELIVLFQGEADMVVFNCVHTPTLGYISHNENNEVEISVEGQDITVELKDTERGYKLIELTDNSVNTIETQTKAQLWEVHKCRVEA